MTKSKTVEEPVAPVEAASVIERLLALEDEAHAEAANYPTGDNSDAMKSALSNAAHGIAHVRKVLAANEALVR